MLPCARFYSWKLALLTVAIVIFMVFPVATVGTLFAKATESASVAGTAASGTAQESLGAIRTLASLTGESRSIEKYKLQVKHEVLQ